MRLNKDRGYTFCMIEHDMDFIGRLCDPVIVMAEGRVLAEGSIDEIKANEQVIEAYLGTGLKNKDKLPGDGRVSGNPLPGRPRQQGPARITKDGGGTLVASPGTKEGGAFLQRIP